MKPSTYKLHRIGAGVFLAIYLPLAADFIFRLGYFGRTGHGMLLLMLGGGIVYGFRYAPTRLDVDEYRKWKRSGKSYDRGG